MTMSRSEVISLYPRAYLILAELAEPDDELWAPMYDRYYISNYGLVLDTKDAGRLIPWRRCEQHGKTTFLVYINDSSLYLSSVVFAAFRNNGNLLRRTHRLCYTDGNPENVRLSNLYSELRTYTQELDTLSTQMMYAKMLESR